MPNLPNPTIKQVPDLLTMIERRLNTLSGAKIEDVDHILAITHSINRTLIDETHKKMNNDISGDEIRDLASILTSIDESKTKVGDLLIKEEDMGESVSELQRLVVRMRTLLV